MTPTASRISCFSRRNFAPFFAFQVSAKPAEMSGSGQDFQIWITRARQPSPHAALARASYAAMAGLLCEFAPPMGGVKRMARSKSATTTRGSGFSLARSTSRSSASPSHSAAALAIPAKTASCRVTRSANRAAPRTFSSGSALSSAKQRSMSAASGDSTTRRAAQVRARGSGSDRYGSSAAGTSFGSVGSAGGVKSGGAGGTAGGGAGASSFGAGVPGGVAGGASPGGGVVGGAVGFPPPARISGVSGANFFVQYIVCCSSSRYFAARFSDACSNSSRWAMKPFIFSMAAL